MASRRDKDRTKAPAPADPDPAPAPAAVERIYGLAAARAAFAVRPEQVLRIAYSERARLPLAEMLRAAARRRIAYRELSDEELAQMAGAVHHEGVCVLARPRVEPSLDELAERTKPRGLLAALDGVDNPHNVGAVLRSAAFFGVAGLLIADPKRRVLTSASRRIAEGGAEHVPLVHCAELAPALRELRARGLRVIGSDSGRGLPLSELRWPPRCVLVLGAEDRGLSSAVRGACDETVRIGGTNAVESLNVSVAAGVLFASYAR
jgi:TrmH RNA methyltransferase